MYHFALEGFTMYTKQYGYPTAQHMFSVTPNVMRAQSMVLLPLSRPPLPPPPKCDRLSKTQLQKREPSGWPRRTGRRSLKWTSDTSPTLWDMTKMSLWRA